MSTILRISSFKFNKVVNLSDTTPTTSKIEKTIVKYNDELIK